MAIFGRYQTVRELYRSGFTVLYSGRTSASSEADYAIKVFQPSPLLLETEQVRTESDLFLNSACIQQKTASSGAQYWAPIHECDSIPNGAFYATDKYDRSLKRLIDTNISLMPQAFLKIIESIALGLLELKKACGRPHGNLKATNILIAGKGDISQTKIVLSDPLPDEHVDIEVHWDSDLREIAELIYQLVIHRPSPNVDGWQAPDSKEWTKLGKQAQEWRNLCNRLLVTHMKPGTMTLEILIRELARLKKIKPVFTARRLLLAAVLVVIAGIAMVFLIPDKAAKLEDWSILLTEYENWVDDLRGDLIGPNSNQREQRWKNNPHLGAVIVENIINNRKASFPYKVATDNRTRVKDLRTMITAQEDMDKYDITLPKTNAALKAVEIIKYFFGLESDPNSFRFYDPNLPQDKQEYKRWPIMAQTQQSSELLSNRGWQRSAIYLENLMNDIKPDPNIAENVDKILELQPTLYDIKSHWTEIENNEKTITNAGEPFLTRFNNYIKQEPAMALEYSTTADVNNVGKKLLDELQNRKQSSRELAKSIDDNWQKLKENQNTIKSPNDPILNEFPNYIQLKLASVNPEILGRELEEMGNLADELAKFIKDNWQNVDKKTFFNDHGNDSEQNPSNEIFTKRRDTIDGYILLDPKTLDELFALENIISEYMELALASNPVVAQSYSEAFKVLQQDINKTKAKPAIKKYQVAINDLKIKLQKLSDKVIAAAEKPEKFLDRITKQNVVSDEALDEINEKWRALRDNLLDKNPLDLNNPNLVLYTQLRSKIEDTNDELNKLNEELQRELPSHVRTELKEKDWNKKLSQFYDQQRKNTIKRIVENIPLPGDIPDINVPPFRQFSRTQFSSFQQFRDDLIGISAAFNEIEDGLDLCYLLDQKLPESERTVRLIWDQWKDKVLKDAITNETLAELTKRIIDLEKIEKSDDRNALGNIATEPDSQTEAIYAAWKRLGEISDPKWPDTDKEWVTDKEIQEILKAKLTTIKAENRATELRNIFADISLKREKIYRGANIQRYKTIITEKSSSDPILITFQTLEPNDADADLNEVKDFENLAQALAEFVSEPNWPEKYRTDLFVVESPTYKKAYFTKNDFQTWMKEVKDYYKLDNDPRKNHSWDERIDKIDGLINKELARKQAAESRSKLQNLKGDFDNVKSEISNVLSLPAIEKYKTPIIQSEDYWTKLLEIERSLKPEYCNRIELENEQIIFTSNKLHPNFEPIFDADNKMPVTLKAGWEDIRKAVNEKQKGWLDFFYKIDSNDIQNSGWPKYARSRKDPSVILRFIPAGPGNPEPFYMATQEISNSQYRLYLEKISAVKPRIIGTINLFQDQNNNDLIRSGKYEDPARACKITSNGKSFNVTQGNEDIPVTWVTYGGAQSYAKWLDGRLPSVSQHKYACKAQNNIPPWINEQEIPTYAHVRGDNWKTIADEYNNTLINTGELRTLIAKKVPAPVGAKPEDFVSQKTTLDLTQTVHEEKKYGSPWPIDHAESTNRWGLYDMIGNVWEWCQNGTQSVICGGSCLAPPKYVRLTDLSNYSVEFSNTACDVGFRIIVPAK